MPARHECYRIPHLEMDMLGTVVESDPAFHPQTEFRQTEIMLPLRPVQ